ACLLRAHNKVGARSRLLTRVLRFDAWFRSEIRPGRGAMLKLSDMMISDPEKNFEVLWTTFHNRYPFFNLRNVDWEKQYDAFRPQVTTKTSDDELVDIFCQMLGPLNDGHVE